MHIFDNPNFNFIRWRWHALIVSLVVIGAVILAAVVVNARAEMRGVKLILPEARLAAGAAK